MKIKIKDRFVIQFAFELQTVEITGLERRGDTTWILFSTERGVMGRHTADTFKARLKEADEKAGETVEFLTEAEI